MSASGGKDKVFEFTGPGTHDLRTLADLALAINANVRGWINYYGRSYRRELIQTLKLINHYLMRYRSAGQCSRCMIGRWKHCARLYRELVKQAIARTASELEARVAEQAAERQASRNAKRSEPADPLAEAERDEHRQLRVGGTRECWFDLNFGGRAVGWWVRAAWAVHGEAGNMCW